jgi:pilus assembly protein CpaB
MAVSVVTLLVNPEDSERLTLASTEGKIQLALRNPLDKSAPPTPGVRPANLLGANKPVASQARRASRPPTAVVAAAAPVEAPPTVEVIRGDKRAQESVR